MSRRFSSSRLGSSYRGSLTSSTSFGDNALNGGHSAAFQQQRRNPSSDAVGRAIFARAASGRRQAALKRKELEAQKFCFKFQELPFDLQEYTLRFLPVREIGMCSAVCRAWQVVYEGAVASVFATIVGVARGRSRLVRRAELKLLTQLRHLDCKRNALEMLLWGTFNKYNDFVVRLLRERASLVTIDTPGSEAWDGATALHVACRQGNLPLIDKMLKMGAAGSVLTRQKRTPLSLACEHGLLDVVEMLLASAAAKTSQVAIDAVDANGKTALYLACERNHVKIVGALLGAAKAHDCEALALDINLGTPDGGSPLCVASRNGCTPIVVQLLDAGCYVNRTTEDSRTALFLAAERGAASSVRAILARRPAVTEAELKSLHAGMSETEREEAAERSVKLLVEVPRSSPDVAGVIIDLQTSTGKTSLFVASEKGNSELVSALLAAGALTNKPTFLNKTPLYAATENGHAAVVRELLTRSTREDVLHQTNFGTTALFMAQRNGNKAIQGLLTEFCVRATKREKIEEKKRRSHAKQFAAMKRLTSAASKLAGSFGHSEGEDADGTRESRWWEEEATVDVDTIVKESRTRVRRLQAELLALERAAERSGVGAPDASNRGTAKPAKARRSRSTPPDKSKKKDPSSPKQPPKGGAKGATAQLSRAATTVAAKSSGTAATKKERRSQRSLSATRSKATEKRKEATASGVKPGGSADGASSTTPPAAPQEVPTSRPEKKATPPPELPEGKDSGLHELQRMRAELDAFEADEGADLGVEGGSSATSQRDKKSKDPSKKRPSKVSDGSKDAPHKIKNPNPRSKQSGGANGDGTRRRGRSVERRGAGSQKSPSKERRHNRSSSNSKRRSGAKGAKEAGRAKDSSASATRGQGQSPAKRAAAAATRRLQRGEENTDPEKENSTSELCGEKPPSGARDRAWAAEAGAPVPSLVPHLKAQRDLPYDPYKRLSLQVEKAATPDTDEDSAQENIEEEDDVPLGREEVRGIWAWGSLAGIALRKLHKSLLKFSKATSGYRMDQGLFAKVFGVSDAASIEVYRRFGTQPSAFAAQREARKQGHNGSESDGELVADAWEVFVAGALFADAPVRERLRFCFGLFDMERKGQLNHAQVLPLPYSVDDFDNAALLRERITQGPIQARSR